MIHCKGVDSGYQSRDRPDNKFYFEQLKKVKQLCLVYIYGNHVG
jgi:hypothetical protein